MVEIESSRKDKRDQIFELNAEKKKITIKLDALRDFHAKRDIKVRQDLAKEQELRNNIEGDIKTFADREKFLNDQIEGRFKNVFRLSGNWLPLVIPKLKWDASTLWLSDDHLFIKLLNWKRFSKDA